MANNAVQLDGSTQFGTVLNYADIDSLVKYTVEGWFYRHDTNLTFAVATAISKSDGSAHFHEIQRDSSGATGINFATKFSTTSADGFKTAGPFTADTYIYVALVFDLNNDIKSHIFFGTDATLAEITSYNLQNTGSGTETSPATMNLYMGTDPADSGSGKWLGNVGGFLRVWNYNRSLAQLRGAYNKTLQSKYEPGLIANFNFAEGSGATIANEYATGNQMSLTGSPTWVTGPTTEPRVYINRQSRFIINNLRPRLFAPGVAR